MLRIFYYFGNAENQCKVQTLEYEEHKVTLIDDDESCKDE